MKKKKLTDNQFYKLRKGALIVESNDAEGYRILAEVIAVKTGQSVTLKRIRFLPPDDADTDSSKFLATFEPLVTVSINDESASAFSGGFRIEPNETPVTNSVVSYFKIKFTDVLCGGIKESR